MATMQMDTSGGGSGAEKKTDGLLTINDLNYALEPDLSVAVNRTHKQHFFQSTEYTDTQRAICILNSGADYIDTRRSWLAFDIDVYVKPGVAISNQGTTDEFNGFRALLGRHGSAMNIINTLTISTRSGDELVRLRDFALMQNMLCPMMYSKEWHETNGDMFDFGGSLSVRPTTADVGTWTPRAEESLRKNKVVIPMYLLSNLFGYGRLMPAMLMSGLRIEIEWARPDKAFTLYNGRNIGANDAPNTFPHATATATNFRNAALSSFVVRNPYFNLCSVQLSDSIQRALNEQSAVNGLEIVYSDYERSQQQHTGFASSVHLEVRKSCSRALKAFARLQLKDSSVADSRVDSHKSEVGFPFTEYQWQLGSLYFPQQPIKATTTETNQDMARETYALCLDSFEKFAKGASEQPLLPFSHWAIHSSVDLAGIDGAYTSTQEPGYTQSVPQIKAAPGTFLYDQHTIGVNLERSSLFNLAGVPINNSRVLALNAKMLGSTLQNSMVDATAGSGGDPVAINPANARRTMYIFLKYVKLARVFLNNVEVEQ